MTFQPARAFEHIDKLAYEIGPRLAGSRGDQMAVDYIKAQFSGAGLETQFQDFNFVGRQLKRRTMAVVFGAAFVSILFLAPIISLLVWAAAIAAWKTMGKILPKSSSRNVVARLRTGEPKKTVAISAHFDSATCTSSRKFALFVRFSLLPVMALVIGLLSARVLFAMEGGWLVMWIILAFYFLPLCAYFYRTGSIRTVSPGANDNAAGVAVMMEVAKVLKETPPQDTEVIFIATGAEEQGLIGMKRVADGKLLPPGTPVLNLDGVGYGSQPYVIEGNGTLRKIRTSSKLNQVLAAAIEKNKSSPKNWWSAMARHDHIPLLKAGYEATTLTFDAPETERNRFARFFSIPNANERTYKYIHSKDDLPTQLELKTIEKAGQIVLDFVKAI